MANFERAYKAVADFEGGYDNDPNDTGGETFKGVSRNNFPKWSGWALIDEHKQNGAFPQNALNDPTLSSLVQLWYKETFWDVFNLDRIAYDSVALEVFEQSVNHGVGRGARHIQEVCNALNYHNQFGSDITVDGKIGPATKSRLEAVTNSSSQMASAVANGLNCLQGAFYIGLGNSKSSKSDYRKYTKGWLSNRTAAYAG